MKNVVKSTIVLAGSVSKQDLVKAYAAKLEGVDAQDIVVTMVVKVTTKLTQSGSKALFTCGTALCKAKTYALQKSLSQTTGVPFDKVEMTFKDARRRMQHTLARQLRVGNVEVGVTLTATEDISAKVSPSALQSGVASEYIKVLAALPTEHAGAKASLPTSVSVVAAVPATTTTAVVTIKTASAAAATAAAANSGLSATDLSSAGVSGVTVTSVTSAVQTPAPTAAPTAPPTEKKAEEKSSPVIFIIIGIVVVGIIGAVVYFTMCNNKSAGGKEGIEMQPLGQGQGDRAVAEQRPRTVVKPLTEQDKMVNTENYE